MHHRVFRGHPAGTHFGLIVSGVGLLIAIEIALYGSTDGVSVNEVRRFDSAATNGGIAIASLVCLLGAGVMAASYVARTHIEGAEIRIYDWLNRVVFRSEWSEVSRYEPKLSEFGWRYWQISAGGATRKVQSSREPAELHREILRRLPPGALAGEARPVPPRDPADEVENSPHYNSADHFMVIIAAVVYLFLGGFGWVCATGSVSKSDSDRFVFSVIVPFGFAGIAAIGGSGFLASCDRLVFGSTFAASGCTRNSFGPSFDSWRKWSTKEKTQSRALSIL